MTTLSLTPGSTAWLGQKKVTITAAIGIDKVLVMLDDGAVEVVAIAALTESPPDDTSAVTVAPDLATVSEQDWQQAVKRAEVIRKIGENPRNTKREVEDAARSIGIGVAAMYRLITRWRTEGEVVSALLPRKTGPKPGTVVKVSPEMLAIIESTIDDVWMATQKTTKEAVINEVNRRCHRAGMAPPSPTTVRRRIDARSQYETVKAREGTKVAKARFAPVLGEFPATSWPLQVVQIDHTPVDAIVLDQTHRKPIGRPWLTLAIDVHTRMVVGFLLSLDAPCATSVALCLAHAITPKDEWLARRRIDAKWPVWGTPDTIHVDNGKDFHSEALTRGCEQYGITLDYRPVRTPNYGGNIERLIGTMMGKVHMLPGTTFSNIKEKGNYDPEKHACMTLPEMEEWLALGIDVYHRSIHSALMKPPLAAWEEGILGTPEAPGRGYPARITNPQRFLIDFLPLERRTVGREGVLLFHIRYWSDVLRVLIGDGENYLVRYDLRDLSRIWLRSKDGEYYQMTYRSRHRPPISLWEHRHAIQELKEAGRRHVDEAAIFDQIERMRRIVDDAAAATKKARRQSEKRKAAKGAETRIDLPPAEKPKQAPENSPPAPTPRRVPKPFDVEEW